ncbi:MAG: DUF971 domain-containing protein [Anaerolineales bacterium]
MKPTSITANREKKELTVLWDDGHASWYSFSLLRAGCPCAECRGGHAQMGDIPNPAVFETPVSDSSTTRLKAIAPVGSYAITLVWEDGHDSGIYQWRYLRALCPCDECKNKKF